MNVAVDGRVIQARYHGIGRHTLELLRELAACGLELTVFHTRHQRGQPEIEGLGQRDNVQLARFDGPVVSLGAQLRWIGALRAVHPDVLLVPYHLSTPWIHPGVPVVAVVAVVHDGIFERDPALAPYGLRFQAAYRIVTRLALRRASAVATVSQATQNDVRRFYGLSLPDDAVLPHGVGAQFFSGPAEVTSEATQDLRLRYILHVGVRRPHKNQEVLIDAFAEVARRLADVQLILVGQPDERFPDTVGQHIESAGLSQRVQLLPHVEEERLLGLYKNAAVFAFPSLVEGFGLPLLEAMAAGVPVIASDADAVVEAYQGAALIVPARDSAGWAEALLHLLSEPPSGDDRVERGRRLAAQRTWRAAADQTFHLLERAACPRSEGR